MAGSDIEKTALKNAWIQVNRQGGLSVLYDSKYFKQWRPEKFAEKRLTDQIDVVKCL